MAEAAAAPQDMPAWVRAMNRVAKWRMVFAGWQLGTRSKADPECQAVRDHRELTIALRVEVNALTALLVRAGVITVEQFQKRLGDEATALAESYAQRFPGLQAVDDGIEITDAAAAQKTMKGWKP